MYHLVARTRNRQKLFYNDEDALYLWRSLVRAFPDPHALCVMPDHIHLILPHNDPEKQLGAWMSGYARHIGGGVLWEPAPPPVAIPNAQHLRRTVRYVHLNPCRARLVHDPLAWPWSTHRDRVGLAFPAVGKPDRDPHAFHQFVSADPTCSTVGTPFPNPPNAALRAEDLLHAVSAVTRTLPSELYRRGTIRPFALRAIFAFASSEFEDAARDLGLRPRTARAWRARFPSNETSREIRAIQNVACDRRFLPLREAPPPSPFRTLAPCFARNAASASSNR